MLEQCHLILGGARSGKSRFAQHSAEASASSDLVYIATATAGDEEMSQRIEKHQQQRHERWVLEEEPLHLARAIQRHDNQQTIILVDCLTLWLSNCLHQSCWQAERDALLAVLPNTQAKLLLVNNETGMGIVPMGELSRTFADENGFLNQELAGLCSTVTLLIAGIPQVLKAGDTSD